MKKTRRLLSLIMAAVMLTLSMVTGVWAEDVIITDDVIEIVEPVEYMELQPLAAYSCQPCNHNNFRLYDVDSDTCSTCGAMTLFKIKGCQDCGYTWFEADIACSCYAQGN